MKEVQKKDKSQQKKQRVQFNVQSSGEPQSANPVELVEERQGSPVTNARPTQLSLNVNNGSLSQIKKSHAQAQQVSTS